MNANLFDVREMQPSDYDAVAELWQRTENVGLSDADSRENIEAYLFRNPGMSLVAHRDGTLVGAILGGHDGRRGYLHHLAVAHVERKQGLGRKLVEECLTRIQAQGIGKCHIFIFEQNVEGQTFWQRAGWTPREDLKVMSRTIRH